MHTEDATIESVTGISLNQDNDSIVVFPRITQKQLAMQDVLSGISNWRIWWMLSYQDIKLRYKRSVLGPFWITLSMAITVYSMGYLYSHLFRIPLDKYFPYLVSGMLGWTLISTTITEMVEAFSVNEGMLKQIKLPYSLYIHRIATRNLIIFFHNILVFLPIAIYYHTSLTMHLLLLAPGLIIFYLNSITFGLAFAIIGARYRDISQLIKSLIQIIFFLTPVMWNPEILPAKIKFLVNFNPAYSLLELIRAPLLGTPFEPITLIVILFTSIIGLVASYFLFVSRRARIIYWL